MQPSTSQYAPGCTGGILSNLGKENLRDVDVLSFGLLCRNKGFVILAVVGLCAVCSGEGLLMLLKSTL